MKPSMLAPDPEPHDWTEACWSALRLLRKCVDMHAEPMRFVSMRIGSAPTVTIDRRLESEPDSYSVTILVDAAASALPPSEETLLRIDAPVAVEVVQSGALPDALLAFMRVYLPYCFVSATARRLERTVAICHFAQTLDGRIATERGDSRWIGCPENLVHAHRMRALCDAVLIGSGTLRRDHPRLNVRHVEGSDPLRIVIGSAPLDLASLFEASPAPVLTIGFTPVAGAELIDVARRNGRVHGEDILRSLYARGVRSLLIEGGAATTSALLEDGVVDVVQFHIEPLLLGPGVSSFQRSPVGAIAEAMTFRHHEFVPIGRGVMFVGWR